MEEQTVFRLTLGDSPVIRVLEFLIEGRGLDYSLTDIAENSQIGWTTLHRIWDNLEKTKVVVPTRVIGKAKLYKLNLDNPAVQQLVKMFDTLIYLQTEKFFEKDAVVAESSARYGKKRK